VDKSDVQDTMIALIAAVIVSIVFGGFVVYKGSREVGHVVAQVVTPVTPHFEKSVINYRPMWPSERVQYGHTLFKTSEPVKPKSIWADAARNEG
jgi:hypothetical protein